jgi:cytosine/adenosine deaminase-related metal-dependent hydrolase
MFTAMRSALVVARGLPNAERLKAGENPMALHLHPRDVLAFATIEGARALGKADVTGSITVGKKADIVTMTTDDISVFPVVDPVSAIVYGGSRRAVTNVFVDGRRRKADGALVGVDTAALHEAADRAARADRAVRHRPLVAADLRLIPRLGPSHAAEETFSPVTRHGRERLTRQSRGASLPIVASPL